MRNAECGITGLGRFSERAPEHDKGPVNSAFRIPHSASALVRGPEARMASEVSPGTTGRFGPYGGRYVPETLMGALEELARVYEEATRDPKFWAELDALLKNYVGRPTPITETPRLAAQVGSGVVVLLKREDLNHTGAHKINNTLGQVRDFQSVIGREARAQVVERYGRLPHTVVACVGGGSNALGIFTAFLGDAAVALVGVEAAGEGLASGHHAASLAQGRPGVFHGSLSYLLQNADGQVQPAHSVSAGLDYPGVGPEHAYLKDSGRVLYEAVTDRQALDAFAALSRLEGILPALESAHAVAWVMGRRGHWHADDVVLINLSGRGDKDVAMVAELTGAAL